MIVSWHLVAAFEGWQQDLKSFLSSLDSILDEDDDDDDIEKLCERLPDDTAELERNITAAQGCMLLLIAKQQLKEIYGITDRWEGRVFTCISTFADRPKFHLQ